MRALLIWFVFPEIRRIVLTMHALGYLILPLVAAGACAAGDDSGRIQPYPPNPHYWQYQGRPLLLLGGSDDDNLFQWTGQKLTEQLDLLVSCGGNYIRNTMSSRDEGNLFPFAKTGDRYDLDQWNPAYWERFDDLLRETRRRGIIVQIELFDMHDLIDADLWDASPWNPRCNINYTYRNTRLPHRPDPVAYRGGESVGKPHPFFLSIPAANDDRVLLDYQRRFVDRVLQHTLPHDHVLFCVSNEIHPEYPPQWGLYWAQHLRQKADEAGRRIEVTEMFWPPDMTHKDHLVSLARPEVFSFFEASQNSANSGQKAWDQLQSIRERLHARPRPINHTKIYGADTGPDWSGGDREAVDRFWRNIIGGSASSRFHRPPYGLGIGPLAQSQIRAMRMLTGEMDIFKCAPHNELLTGREPNEAYCQAEPGLQYAVYFPDGGAVTLKVPPDRSLQIRWLDLSRGEWHDPTTAQSAGTLELAAPGKGRQVVLVKAR